MAIMRLNYFTVFMRSKILITIWSPDCANFHEIKICAFLSFKLMNNLLVTSTVMRSKFANNAFLSFDLMINLLVTRTIMRLKLVIMLFWVLISWSKCWTPDQYYWTPLISWKSWILISWSLFWSHEKVEFWSHEKVEFWSHKILPPDPHSVI